MALRAFIVFTSLHLISMLIRSARPLLRLGSTVCGATSAEGTSERNSSAAAFLGSSGTFLGSARTTLRGSALALGFQSPLALSEASVSRAPRQFVAVLAPLAWRPPARGVVPRYPGTSTVPLRKNADPCFSSGTARNAASQLIPAVRSSNSKCQREALRFAAFLLTSSVSSGSASS